LIWKELRAKDIHLRSSSWAFVSNSAMVLRRMPSQARIGFECRLVKDFPTLKECCGLLSILANVALLKMSQRQMISFLLLTDFLSMLLPKLQPSKQMNLK
jgi:hypothetical protein